MWFDAKAELSELGQGREINAQPPATMATPATAPAYVAIVADVAAPPKENPEIVQSPHGVSVAGHPLTWTGRVVLLDAWRALSDWERHGPDGRLWDGRTKQWQQIEGQEK